MAKNCNFYVLNSFKGLLGANLVPYPKGPIDNDLLEKIRK